MKRFLSIPVILIVAGVGASVVADEGALGAAPQGRSSKMFDSAALLADAKTLSADDMNGRSVGSVDGEKARTFLAGRLKTAGLVPFGASFDQPFTFKTGGRNGAAPIERHGVNLVGHIVGTQQPDRYIVVTAHYDHLAPRNGVVMNGADDNASGAAALVAIASYFVTHRPANSIIIVACDGEEAGLQGAKAFVAAPPVPATSFVANVNFDMIGRDPDNKLFAVGTFLNPFLKPYVAEVAKASPIKLLMGHDDPANKALDDWTHDSDHDEFWKALKLPFIYLGDEDEAQHHKPTDDYETMTYDFYIGAVETGILLIEDFDRNAAAITRAAAARKG